MIVRAYSLSGRQPGGSGQALAMMLVFLVACAGVAWVTMGMTTREQWPVRWLELGGAFERISAEQLRASLAPLVTGSFFTVDMEEIKQTAYRQPWVAQAAVSKLWPDTVSVRVVEYQPVAHWTQGRLVSTDGDAFSVPGASEIQGLPWLEGPEEKLDEVFKSWRYFNNLLMPTGQEIQHIRLDARGSWFVELSNGTEVQIGREAASERLHRLVDSWAELLQGRDLAPMGIDLRYTNGFAVRWPEAPRQIAGTYGQKN
ncbi:MAG: FtsQ-type POTRA domain-containing protein [Xanthomonadales bacterium]|nr:cell division protein FtsQ/DivIB [Gammaproteobacteria bacterium]NNE06172.1 FtsQ-type POTRA domain-containing protein [Xanthomonadales bacterium]NNL95640.1 FtsQ-type POTRA domain-containing protein [Xanthomonadales bacterium]